MSTLLEDPRDFQEVEYSVLQVSPCFGGKECAKGRALAEPVLRCYIHVDQTTSRCCLQSKTLSTV